jgi:Na+-driven multidrug efflux pump
VDYLRILAYGYPAIGATYLVLAGFNGARRTRTSMVATLLQYWGVRVPVAAVGGLLLGFGVHAAFWAITLSNVAAAFGAGWYYRWATRRGMLDRAVDDAVE